MQSKRLSDLTRLMAQLREPGTQFRLLGGLVGILVLIILVLDLAKGGEAKPPPALGAAIQASPGTRVGGRPRMFAHRDADAGACRFAHAFQRSRRPGP
jgi:hypothetical protein